MAISYSISTNGFYDSELDYANLPSDLIEISFEKYQELLTGINMHGKEVYLEGNELLLRDKQIIITWSIIRDKRDYLLSRSDYTQISDWPGDKVAWSTYRQQLRDIPQTYTDPYSVVWPTPPGE